MSSKGSPFEREIPVILSEWFTDGERTDIFWRNMASGARATQRAKSNKETFGAYGDIVALDPIGRDLLDVVTLELKRGYKKWSFLDILDRPLMKKGQKNRTYQQFEEFIFQVQKDADLAGTFPVLITKRDKRTKTIILPKDLFKAIENSYGNYDGIKIIIENPEFKFTMVAINFDLFIAWCDPAFFKKVKEP